ncbi:Kunitz-type proteinase inhibitor 5 II [Echinococcus granulosus]|uniref:Kunitz-type proteinase inhibitor 5 II n=1 Tax=Echinococcus granulosus TaxID=6210 RepID=W6UEG6_ECHGR|nr:Kunitz-type proteinase inhibitor 5 II [Echinococcus granulosus]EUB59840.1 Kunitz-type proteinase inhibitor 5 II [Echinococcus granulosus]
MIHAEIFDVATTHTAATVGANVIKATAEMRTVNVCGQESENVCSLPTEVGPCAAAIQRYTYNRSTGRCEAFYYGGCGGNTNNFKTLEECQQRCESSYHQGEPSSGNIPAKMYDAAQTPIARKDDASALRATMGTHKLSVVHRTFAAATARSTAMGSGNATKVTVKTNAKNITGQKVQTIVDLFRKIALISIRAKTCVVYRRKLALVLSLFNAIPIIVPPAAVRLFTTVAATATQITLRT